MEQILPTTALGPYQIRPADARPAEARPADPRLTESYEALVRDYRAAFSRLARRMTGDAEDAEDLLQETLVDAYRSFQQYRGGTHFYSWVARIMTNNHLDRVRRKQHPTISLDRPGPDETADTLELPDESGNPERALLSELFDQRMESALGSLQPVQRTTVLLCDLEGATYEEAAAVQSCPIGTIRSRLHRAHAALQKALAAPVSVEASTHAADRRRHSRRDFLRFGTAAAAGAALAGLGREAAAEPRPLQVLVWTGGAGEASAYPQGVAEALASGLRPDRRLDVTTASVLDPEQGLSDSALRQADVLLWWGGPEQGSVRADRAAAVARRVREGKLGLIVTHAAGDCAPLASLLGNRCAWDSEELEAGSGTGKSVKIEITAPRHPIARGVGEFSLEQGACCRGRLLGPRPDMVVFSGARTGGWQGVVWKPGNGRVFYFAPGHEGSPVYLQEEVRQILRNAVHWCAEVQRSCEDSVAALLA